MMMCKPLFVLYRDCVREAIKKQNINLSEIEKEFWVQVKRNSPLTKRHQKVLNLNPHINL